jgi:hypothetical protein
MQTVITVLYTLNTKELAFFLCACGVWHSCKYSKATLPSTLPNAKPDPSLNIDIQRV